MKDSLDSYQTKTNFGYFMGIKLSKPIINSSNNLSYLYNNDNIYQTIDDNLIEENSMDELSNACQQLKDRAKTILDKYNSVLDKYK